MNIKFFLNRPILAGVISILIVLLGTIGLWNLPMEQYPDIAPPTISVRANYTGASADVVLKSVVIPLEEAINGVENMQYMTSSATNSGSGSISIIFEQGTNPDLALINVKNRVSKAERSLPQEVTKIGVTVEKRQASMLRILALYSPTDKYDRDFITNYFNINIAPKFLRIKGVGSINVMGGDYAMRIWLNPRKLALHNLVPNDVVSALRAQNLEAPIGTIGEDGSNTFQYTLKYRGGKQNATEFEEIIIRSLPDGSILKLGDIAEVELGTVSYAFDGNIKGHAGATAMVSQTADSNAHEINENIDKLLEELKDELPAGLEFVNMMDTNDFLNAATNEVLKTLLETILLVILVVYIFLQSARSTIIPTISIIVSLIGTFAFMYVVGFTLNLLTLFALVLVIGTVVDDAIVVVEAVQAKFDEGERSPYQATRKAMGGIASAIITTSLVFMAVFIPTSFMGGTSGTYYQQFGLTMAVAVGLSAINALTLCPALSALLMTPHDAYIKGKKLSFSTRFNHAFNTAFRTLVFRYKNGLKGIFRHRWIAWTLLILTGIAIVLLVRSTQTGLIPDEDMGTIFVNIKTPAGSTLEQTKKTVLRTSQILDSIPEIKSYATVVGFSMLGGQSSTGGMLIIKLCNWEERTGKGQGINAIIGRIMMKTQNIKSASIFAFAQPTIMGYSSSNGVEFYVQDHAGGNIEKLFAYTNQMIAALRKRPEISQAQTTYDIRYPQYLVDVNAAHCLRMGVSPASVLEVINGYFGGNYASNFIAFSKIYRVMIQAPKQFRQNTEALNNIFVKASSGEMAPINQFITLTKTYGPESLNRFNLYTSISVNAQPADGYSTGDVINAVRETAKETLPTGYGYEYTGITREEANASQNTTIIFAICILFIYLILCALYESLLIPLAVMLSVPFGLFGSFLFAKIWGLSNNVYMQVGLIMLIGLLSKTAILLTEYASARRKAGVSIASAAMSAAGARLRPILMTALTMIIGMLPLAFSTGAGAHGNLSLALGVIGGMCIGTLALLFVVPAFFIALQNLQERWMPSHRIIEKEAADEN